LFAQKRTKKGSRSLGPALRDFPSAAHKKTGDIEKSLHSAESPIRFCSAAWLRETAKTKKLLLNFYRKFQILNDADLLRAG
jgi:hypothetical protein